ncbi:MAG TPA: DNA polymerase III subunit delta [Tepidisphaeraceae bacterium]|nr:DNA polymerase III subunit delta [Tepidisphaeraceae bacterium]
MPTATANKPVHALVGSDSFLQLQKLALILDRAPKGSQRIDIDGERADLAEVLDELRSFAMFGDGKVVVVQNADAFLTRFREQLEEYVAHPSDSATLVLRLSSLPSNQRIYKAIAKTGQIEPCEPPKDLAKWITEQAKQAHQVTISPDAARMLADLIGDDMGRLDNELAKLALSATNGKIDPENVATSVAFQREQQMSEMTNALAAGRAADAVKKWRQLIQGDPSAEFRAVTWLAIWLTNVRKALAMRKQGMQPFAIAQALRIWPREMQGPFFETAQALGDRGVARAMDLLAEIDRQSKSGVGDAAENVERFILSMALT